MNSLAELAKAIGKLVLVGGVGAWVVWHNRAAALQLVSCACGGIYSADGTFDWRKFHDDRGGDAVDRDD